MAPPFARTRDEAQLYLDLHPCERCGSVDVPWESALVAVDGVLARSYAEPRSGADGCPFVGLPGPRAPQSIFQGVVRD